MREVLCRRNRVIVRNSCPKKLFAEIGMERPDHPTGGWFGDQIKHFLEVRPMGYVMPTFALRPHGPPCESPGHWPSCGRVYAVVRLCHIYFRLVAHLSVLSRDMFLNFFVQ